MTGQLGIVRPLHFDRAYQHARHYTGTPESSGFLTGYFALEGGEFANSRLCCPGWLGCVAGPERRVQPRPIAVATSASLPSASAKVDQAGA